MTGRRTDHRTAAKALEIQCPRCQAKPGIRCLALVWATPSKTSTTHRHCRLHVERLTVARHLIRKAYAA